MASDREKHEIEEAVMPKWVMLIALALAWLGCADLAGAKGSQKVTSTVLSADEDDLIQSKFHCIVKEDKRCRVDDPVGGVEGPYVDAAKILYIHGIKAEIVRCYSSCVTAMDRLRYAAVLAGTDTITMVCAADKADMRIHELYKIVDPHKGWTNGNVEFHDPIYLNPDFIAWVNSKKKWVNGVLTLPRTRNPEENVKLGEDAYRFWPRCTPPQTASR